MLKKNNEIKRKIKALEEEILTLKQQIKPLHTVSVPEQFSSIFEEAERTVNDYFKELNFHPEKGSIDIKGERYILVRASALSYEFFQNFKKNFPNKPTAEVYAQARDFLFDIGHMIGQEDAKQFHNKMKLKDPISKLSAGPIHFAHSGWAFVDILPESNPTPDENFYLKYHHPNSFEAESWIRSSVKSKEPVCIMNAAYSSGWCEESFDIPLTAVEISCRAKGDESCTFIMAQPDKINAFLKKEKNLPKNRIFQIPYFFERKKMEEEMLKNEEMLKAAQKIAKIGSWEYDVKSKQLIWSEELYSIFELDKTKVSDLYKEYLSKVNEDDAKAIQFCLHHCLKTGKPYRLEHEIQLTDNTKKTLFWMGMPQYNSKKEIIKIYGISQDVSETKSQNETLLKNLKEKEILLKEVHHRVKNNLQIISSLLNLQTGFIEDEHIVDLYKESQNRIKSIAAVHELLYQSDDLSQIPFNDYLRKLINDLVFSYFGYSSPVKVDFKVNEKFNIDTSISLGLLINEVVSNSLKHGLENKPGEFIYVEIRKTKQSTFKLRIGDNGSGYSDIKLLENPETLGLMLINELSEQLNGKIVKQAEKKGTHYELIFTSN